MTTIEQFHDRLAKIGIEVTFLGNYPWIYLDTVNEHKVWERYDGNHGFTAFWLPVRRDSPLHINDISAVFKKIREMLTEEGREKDKEAYKKFMEDYVS